MPTEPLRLAVAVFLFAVAFLSPPAAVLVVSGLGSGSTVAVSYASAAVCGIVAGQPTQRIQCLRGGEAVSMQPNVSYEVVAGGRSFFCALRSGGLSLLCWDTASPSFQPKRIYHSETARLTDLTVGDAQVCAVIRNSGVVKCWRGDRNEDGDGFLFPSPSGALNFRAITSGRGFSCGILRNGSRVLCWGNGAIGAEIQREFSGFSMWSLVAGDSHACGLSSRGVLICRGNNNSGQLLVPSKSAFEYSGLALGANHTCAIRRKNGLVVCWGGGGAGESKSMNMVIGNVSFESIAAGLDFTCGLRTESLSVSCWGPGWYGGIDWGIELPLPMVIPGPCVEQGSCVDCGVYPDSETLCGDYGGNICKSCDTELPVSVPLPLPTFPHPPPPQPPPSQVVSQSRSRPSSADRNSRLKVFTVVGSVGAFVGLCALTLFLLRSKFCVFFRKKIHNSAETATGGANVGLRRQRSGTSSKHPERTEQFSFSDLAAATNNFSVENKIGSGSFGTVFKGVLADGLDVAVKRGEPSTRKRKSQDKRSAFDSELALLSRLHHKHLVGLVGFCHESDEMLLVYEYMGNGALYDHLHSKNNVEKGSSILNSWRMRIKIALDASRGIEYLHNYAVPPIIHRDIKSSNILLDSNWMGRVSDFGLSLMGPEFNQEFTSSEAAGAVGTVGYIDPEYYVLNVLTTKSDVYGLGVVLLELLTGKRAVFKNEEDGADPIGVVEYAVPRIAAGELDTVLDRRVGPPEVNEAEAVRLVAYTAMHCVSLEVRQRPTVSEIASNLEGALALCEGSQGSISNSSFSIHSD